jgi:hypothetical protein
MAIIRANIAHSTLPKLRSVMTVTASTAHLTPVELQRITDAFQMEREGNTHRCLEDISHDGLYMSPKDSGFIVRIPGDEVYDEVLPGLTPEMRSLVESAHAQLATRIEFDSDEDAVVGFPVFEH